MCRPYYELRANYNGLLKAQKKRIEELERNVAEAKAMYNEALKNLEKISEEIHRMREERRLRGDDEDRSHGHCHPRENGDNDDGLDMSADDTAESYEMSHSSEINSFDEYLSFPPKLSTKASPVRQQKIDKLDCPHLLKDFVAYHGHQSAARQSSSTDSDANTTDIVSIVFCGSAIDCDFILHHADKHLIRRH